MPIRIEGEEFFTAADVHRQVDVARQTLWRWRRHGKVPSGRRYRGRQVVFTGQELEAIREYSNRLEPVEATRSTTLKTLRARPPKRRS